MEDLTLRARDVVLFFQMVTVGLFIYLFKLLAGIQPHSLIQLAYRK